MWRKLSFADPAELAAGAVLTLGLAINITRLVLRRALRVQAEDQSLIRWPANSSKPWWSA